MRAAQDTYSKLLLSDCLDDIDISKSKFRCRAHHQSEVLLRSSLLVRRLKLQLPAFQEEFFFHSLRDPVLRQKGFRPSIILQRLKIFHHCQNLTLILYRFHKHLFPAATDHIICFHSS